MVKKTQFLDQGFRSETQELSGRRTALNLRFLTGNPDFAGEIQMLRQVFRMEIQILRMWDPFHTKVPIGNLHLWQVE